MAAAGQVPPGSSSPLPAHRRDGRALQLRCAQASAAVAAALQPQPLSSAVKATCGNGVGVGGNGTSPGSGSGAAGGDGSTVGGHAAAPAYDDKGWSPPLVISQWRPAGSSWRRLAAAEAAPSPAALPAAGHSCALRLPRMAAPGQEPLQSAQAEADGGLSTAGASGGGGCGESSGPQYLSVSLAASAPLAEHPTRVLTLLPHGVLHNCTGRGLALEAAQGAGGWSSAATAGAAAGFDWGALQPVPTEVPAPLLVLGCRHALCVFIASARRCTVTQLAWRSKVTSRHSTMRGPKAAR